MIFVDQCLKTFKHSKVVRSDYKTSQMQRDIWLSDCLVTSTTMQCLQELPAFLLVGKKNNDEQTADQTPKGVAVCVWGAKGDNEGLGQTHHISATHKITQIQKHIQASQEPHHYIPIQPNLLLSKPTSTHYNGNGGGPLLTGHWSSRWPENIFSN